MSYFDRDDEEEEKLSIEDHGVYLFSNEVDEYSCSDLIRWILYEGFERRHEMLTLMINSPGGSVSDGFAGIDIISASKIPIRTVGIGCLASMGLLMFITGEKGKRILTPNTLIMSHQWSGWAEGKEHELVAGIKRNSLINDMVLRHYKRYTGLSVKNINKYLLPPSDVYLSAKEAKDLGLCDEIRLI